MNQRSVEISPKELLVLVEWVSTFDKAPNKIKVISESTAVGTALRAEVETAEGEGRFKDITDYDSW